jgi:arsenate reductase
MAEAFLNLHGKASGFIAESAGLEPGILNPIVVEVMREKDIDISAKTTNDVFEFVKQGRRYHYLITVCDEASAEKCPIFPGVVERLRWSFPDPSSFKGTRDETIQQTRRVRDQIETAVVEFLRVHAMT